MNPHKHRILITLLMGWIYPAQAQTTTTLPVYEQLPQGGVQAGVWTLLQQHPEWLPVEVEELKWVQTLKLGGGPLPDRGERGATLRFSHQPRGIEVLNRALVVRVDTRGQVLWIRHNLVPVPPLNFSLSEQEARRSLSSHLDILTLEEGQKVVWTRGNFSRPAWRFITRDGRSSYYVDAHSGRLLSQEDRWVEASPRAEIYPRSPWHEEDMQEVTLPGAVEAGLYGDTFTMYRCVDRGDVYPYKDVAGDTWQSHICSVEVAPGPTDGDYFYPAEPFPSEPARDEDLFGGPHTWWHLHRVWDYFRQLGVDNLAGIPLGVLTNVRWPDAITEGALEDVDAPLAVLDNAYFSPPYTKSDGTAVTGSLVFGQGTVSDFAYDADVIYHEFTHAVVHSVDGPRGVYADVYGLQVEPAALNEAFADYFSSAIMGDTRVGEYAGLRWEPHGAGIRDLSLPVYCPDDILGEAHQDSLPFSTALWATRSSLAEEVRPQLDQAVFDALTTLLPNSSMAEATEGVVAEVSQHLGEEIGQVLQASFDERGVSHCIRSRSTTPKILNDEPDLSYTALTGQGAFGTEDPAPGPVQLWVDVPPGRQRITLKFLQARFKGIPLTAYGYNRAPQELTLLAQPAVPLLTAYTVDDKGQTYITSSGSRVADAVVDEVADTLEGSRYWYEPYEVHFIVNNQPGRWYLQLANVGPSTSWVYNVYTYLAEDERSPGCDSRGGDGSGVGLMVVGCLLHLRRRGASK